MAGVASLLQQVTTVLPPPASFDDQALRIYVDGLQDVPIEALAAALNRIVRTAVHFPRLAEIRRECAEVLLALPSEIQALDQIERRVSWARQPEHERGPTTPIDHVVLHALDHVGGFYAFKTADNPGVMRAQFLRLYRDLREQTIVEGQVGDLGRLALGEPAQVAELTC